MKQMMLAVIVAAAVTFGPVTARAHQGHAHKVMGTVSAVDGSHVTVKTTDGKSVMVMLDAKTKITRGKATLKSDALKVGDRIVAQGAEAKGMVTATAIQLGAATGPSRAGQ